jgi:AraC-like DNA-binding protein
LDAEAVKWTGEFFADISQELLLLKPGVYPDAGLGQTLVAAHRMLEQGAFRLERRVAWHSAFELLVSRYGRSRPCNQRGGLERVRTKRAREFLHERYDQDITADDLAQLTGLSRFHFMRAFQREIRLSPHAYLNQLRLMAAKRHLTQGLRPVEAAIVAGFYDPSHLNRLFKRTFGITPATYADLGTKHVATLN